MLPPGKHAAMAAMALDFRTQGAGDGGDEVVDLGERLEAEHFGDLDAAELAHLAEVVAEQVGDHDELGDFLGGGLEFVSGAAVLVGIGKPRAGALDGAGLDAAAGNFQEGLGRRTEDFAAVELEVGGHRRGRGVAQRFVEGEEIAGDGGGERLGEICLIDVAGGDPFLDAGDAQR